MIKNGLILHEDNVTGHLLVFQIFMGVLLENFMKFSTMFRFFERSEMTDPCFYQIFAVT